MPGNYLHSDLTGQIIAAAYRVHNQLGPGQSEHACERSLATALINDGLDVCTQVRVRVCDENGNSVSIKTTDIVVNSRVAVEIKALAGPIQARHKNQLRAWLRANGVIAVGLVLNFGSKLEQARVFEPINYDAQSK